MVTRACGSFVWSSNLYDLYYCELYENLFSFPSIVSFIRYYIKFSLTYRFKFLDELIISYSIKTSCCMMFLNLNPDSFIFILLIFYLSLYISNPFKEEYRILYSLSFWIHYSIQEVFQFNQNCKQYFFLIRLLFLFAWTNS